MDNKDHVLNNLSLGATKAAEVANKFLDDARSAMGLDYYQMHKVELDQFQGPLDLLLYFIRRDEIDIYDIPIAKITAEYLQIIEDMKSMNLSIAGEFILMSATLMRIKSKMLLPRPDLDELGEPIDPRTELVQQLIEYRKYKDIADNYELIQKRI